MDSGSDSMRHWINGPTRNDSECSKISRGDHSKLRWCKLSGGRAEVELGVILLSNYGYGANRKKGKEKSGWLISY